MTNSSHVDKKCRVCGDVLPLASFNLARGNKDGHKSTCRRCVRDQRRVQPYCINRVAQDFCLGRFDRMREGE